jgi:hypothetical protein
VAKWTHEDDDLLAELGVEVEEKPASSRSPREERIIAGFEDVVRFVAESGRIPRHAEEADIFERLYAVRLERLREQADCVSLLAPIDTLGLLSGANAPVPSEFNELSDDDLLAELGIGDDETGLSELRHVRSASERREAEDIANRQRCADFAEFKPLFAKVQEELDAGLRQTRAFELKAEIQKGSWFIVDGQKAYVAEMGEAFTNAQGRTDARLRVIFDNGTESNLLMRSLQRALNKDDAGRRLSEPVAGPLFGAPPEADESSGRIYVLRSLSDHPEIAARREIIHKIGVTNMPVEKRIAGARLQPTFMMADVEIVATYELSKMNRVALENLIHRIFGAARLDVEIQDRFGRPVRPKEWFLVPLFIIDEAVARIKDQSILDYQFDQKSMALVKPTRAL